MVFNPGMDAFRDRPTTIERAFALAASGAFFGITTLRKALSREGYGDARVQLDGHFIQKQLVTAMKRANPDGVQANMASTRKRVATAPAP